VLRIEEKAIQITRGDSTRFSIVLENRDVKDGTAAIFAVKKKPWRHDAPVIRKEIETTDGKVHVMLTPDETDIPAGNYVWDVRIREMDEEGLEVFTPMEYARFGVVEAMSDE